ncbi:MAG: insulinase family protein, partial [Candidatus Marinimicrobia bacterium]|nr:insulinase family protein [Candidatus Neomarinimicrobiota bacterium]
YALAILGGILGTGKNSRYYQSLIDRGLATNVSVWAHPFRDNGLFMIYAMLAPEVEHQQVENILLEELRSIQENGITDDEIRRTKAMVRAETAYSRDGSFSIAAALNEAISLGDWTYYTTYVEKLNAVSAADVRSAAQAYLVEDKSTTGWFEPRNKLAGSAEAQPASQAVNAGSKPAFYRGSQAQPPQGPVAADQDLAVGSSNLAVRATDEIAVSGLRLVTMPMEVPEVVSITGSFPGGNIFSPSGQKAVADITASMLDKGTLKRDKFAISDALESVGARLGFSSTDYRINFAGRCLKADVPLMVEILAEQLREPAFHEEDLVSLKKRAIGGLLRQKEDTGEQARIRFSQLVYSSEHPNYIPSIDQQIADLEKLTVDHLKDFHRRHYGLGGMQVVATGEIDHQLLSEELKKHFKDWPVISVSPPSLSSCRASVDQPGGSEVVTVPDKTSVDLYLGLAVGIDREHQDYLPLYLGSYILGGNFAARLMATVRDEQGLTYSIGSGIAGAGDGKDGYWVVYGSFAPGMLKQGHQATMEQINHWFDKGVTIEELEAKKTTLVGSYKVGLANTRGMAATLLDMIERGRDLDYLDGFVEDVMAVTHDNVNAAINEYIRPVNIQEVAAGSIDSNGQPLTSVESNDP